jgi:uncharacterized protein (TIGR00255 family)
MTGFGIGEAPLGDGRISLEIRSLNHRYLDLRVRLPVELGDHCTWLEQRARERVTRGRYDIGARVAGLVLGAPVLSMERARAAFQALLRLRDELSPESPVPISAIAAMADVVTVPAAADAEAVRAALDQALGTAFTALDAMRDSEGRVLGRELSERLAGARRLCDQVSERSDGSVGAYRSRLRARLERLLADASVALDIGRLEMERSWRQERHHRGARAARQPLRSARKATGLRRANRPPHGFLAARDRARGQHRGFEEPGRRHQPPRGRAQGGNRADARAGAKCRMTPHCS